MQSAPSERSFRTTVRGPFEESLDEVYFFAEDASIGR
jgi:hypothetical protein